MRFVFADTFYWLAIFNLDDSWHEPAMEAGRSLRSAEMVTTDEVLAEFLTIVAGFGPHSRIAAGDLAQEILADPRISVLPQTHESFLAGVALYRARPDKRYSLTDCISMHAMREQGLTEVLTHDHHFAQEGFRVILERR